MVEGMSYYGVVLRSCIVIVVVSLYGCAFGNKHAYHDAAIDYRGEGAAKVGIATLDQRIYIISNDKMPDFVGLQRAGFGNPFDVSTESGQALAEDITTALARSLAKKGFNASPVAVSSSEQVDTVISMLANLGVDRSILLVLREWKTDTYKNTGLYYDVTLMVLDGSGNTLAKRSIGGKDNLGGSVWSPPGHAKEAVPLAFKEKMEELLNNNQVLRALK